jgi:Domain of unknown function (DUF6531)
MPGGLDGGQQFQAAEEVKRSNPEAVAEREASRSKFENLNAEQAAKLAGEVFPTVINEPGGGPPRLPAGQSITGYPTDDAAQVEVGGRDGVIESTVPIAIETAPGQRVPVDLGLGGAGGAFEPKTPVVGVRIPKRLSDGVQLPGIGVSLTPVDGSGAALVGSEGTVDGVSVLYANTQTDMDSLIKPVTAGFEADTLLRSVQSPQLLYFRVGLPAGASLVQASDGSGVVQVVDEGAVVMTVFPPSARDAAGTPVPASMTIMGDTLTVTVEDRSGEYEYPIQVDPEFEDVWDEQLTGGSGGKLAPTNWLFTTSHSQKHEHEEGQFRSKDWGGCCELIDEATGSYKSPEFAEFIYQTQGESIIHEVKYNTEESNNEADELESSIELENESESETFKLLSVSRNANESGVIAGTVGKVKNHNWVSYLQAGLANGGNHFTDTLKSAALLITQEVSPTVAYDTSDEYLINGKWINVLDGTNKWIGPNSGAVGVVAEEKGMGVAKIWGTDPNKVYEQNLLTEDKCAGVQCPQKITTTFTYNSEMANGRNYLGTYAQSAAKNTGYASVYLNVDAEKPYNLNVTGLPASDVIGEGQYHLQARATDGKAPTVSSGVKSLVLGLDGYTLSGKAGACTPGPCTVMGGWTINGEHLGVGKHTLTLVATDYAGNVETKSYSVTVRHASPLSVGPGSVDPITGALNLSASDVSIGGGQGSLSVSRSFNSRKPTLGESGPLGPQWRLSVSGAQELEQQPEDGVVLVAPDGSPTGFQSNGKGGFISPKGDENLVLEAEKKGEEVIAYLLKDPASGTTVKYAQPNGSTSSSPWVIASSEGALSKENGEKRPLLGNVLKSKARRSTSPSRRSHRPPLV